MAVAQAQSQANPPPKQPRAPTICVASDCARADRTTTTKDFHPDGYSLVFADEFSGAQLDRALWCTRYVYGGGAKAQVTDPECQKRGDGTADTLNDEKQRYVDFNARSEPMHVVSAGALILRATKTGSTAEFPYESAMIRSKRLFLPTAESSYYITARVMLPNVRGTWPSFWLNSDRKPDGTTHWPPEIDIFEGALNEKEDTADMLRMAAQIRSTSQTPSGKRETTFAAPGFNRRWNTYKATRSLREVWIETAVEWTSDGLCYFVDGFKAMCENYRWAYNHGAAAAPAHVLMNLAIGGNWPGRYGIADEKFPTDLRVDHIRVYMKSVR
ncbi:MAG: glycoside hydrolase family 16 protein [Steroidobacteraceae bacterium]